MVCSEDSNSVGKAGNDVKVIVHNRQSQIDTIATCRWQPNPWKRNMLDKEGLGEEENEKHTLVRQMPSRVLVVVTNCRLCGYIGDHRNSARIWRDVMSANAI